jgi:hypothetical protein
MTRKAYTARSIAAALVEKVERSSRLRDVETSDTVRDCLESQIDNHLKVSHTLWRERVRAAIAAVQADPMLNHIFGGSIGEPCLSIPDDPELTNDQVILLRDARAAYKKLAAEGGHDPTETEIGLECLTRFKRSLGEYSESLRPLVLTEQLTIAHEHDGPGIVFKIHPFLHGKLKSVQDLREMDVSALIDPQQPLPETDRMKIDKERMKIIEELEPAEKQLNRILFCSDILVDRVSPGEAVERYHTVRPCYRLKVKAD